MGPNIRTRINFAEFTNEVSGAIQFKTVAAADGERRTRRVDIAVSGGRMIYTCRKRDGDGGGGFRYIIRRVRRDSLRDLSLIKRQIRATCEKAVRGGKTFNERLCIVIHVTITHTVCMADIKNVFAIESVLAPPP